MVIRRSAWWESFMSFLSYCVIIFIGIALLIAIVLPASAQGVADAFRLIAFVMSIIVVGFLSFFFVMRRPTRRIWWMVSWAVAITLIVVLIILGEANVF